MKIAKRFSSTTFTLLPVLFAYFIMGFCDAVGISSNYVKQDFGLTETQANLLPSMVFLWFFVFSVPVGVLMNRIGRKKTVLLSMIFTFVAMLIPTLQYTFPMVLLAFAMLGIGNTILQVSLNPLLTNVVSDDKLTSSLTAGQFVKAISSFCAPIIAAFATMHFGSWQLMFPIFAVISVVSSVWLLLTPIPGNVYQGESASFGKTFALLKNKSILLFFLGIVFVVGVDVGINTIAPKVLMERCGLPLSEAGYGTSVYFVFRTIGAFLGAILLIKFSPIKFFKLSIVAAVIALGILTFAQEELFIYALIGAIGFTCANIFSIIFGEALKKMPKHRNEISGLMIMGVSGGAVIPLVMGALTEKMNGQVGGLVVIGLCMVYLLGLAFQLKDHLEPLAPKGGQNQF
ncbi:MAG: sugar MFS transporter [Paludibacter sp.]|nr:sugar MFS transporter [Paludibacter sp.]